MIDLMPPRKSASSYGQTALFPVVCVYNGLEFHPTADLTTHVFPDGYGHQIICLPNLLPLPTSESTSQAHIESNCKQQLTSIFSHLKLSTLPASASEVLVQPPTLPIGGP